MKVNLSLTSFPSASVQFTKLYPAFAAAVEPWAVPVAGDNDSLALLTVPPVPAA